MHRALMASMVWAAGVAVPPARALTNTQLAASIPARPSIHKIEELTWPQIDALDRERTMFILPVGAIEEHGPHWSIVLMPPITYGQGGANVIGDMLVHPGTYGIRQSTLRSLVADLGGEIAQNGFKWIFVVNGHGGPTHNIAINEASDFISETTSSFQAYGGRRSNHASPARSGRPHLRTGGARVRVYRHAGRRS